MVSIKHTMKDLCADVQHMHYLLRNQKSSEVDVSDTGELKTRVTEKIPCTTYVELSSFNACLRNKDFFEHSVSYYIKIKQHILILY